MKLLKTLLHTQLKQTNLENRLHISTISPKEGFNDNVFQLFVDELKHCNSDMVMYLQLLVPVFLCLYSMYLVAMLYFRMIFFHNLFYFITFPRKLVPCYKIYLQFLTKVFLSKLPALVLFSIIQDSLD